MSMNLHCKEVELLQTPTIITYYCFYSDLENKIQSRWTDTREKYILWLSEWGNGSQDWDFVNEHTKTLRKKKKLTFSII